MLLSQPRKGSHTHTHSSPGSSPYFCGREFDNFQKACFGLDGSTLSTQCFAEMLGKGLALRKLDKYKRRRIFARFRTNDPDYGCVVTFGLGSLSCVCVCIKRAYHKMVNFPYFSSDECQYCSLDKYFFAVVQICFWYFISLQLVYVASNSFLFYCFP